MWEARFGGKTVLFVPKRVVFDCFQGVFRVFLKRKLIEFFEVL